MNKRNRSIFLAVAAVVVLACACPGTSTTPSQPPATFAPISTIPPFTITEEVDDVPANALLTDDFSSDTGEWEIYSDNEGSIAITNGVYDITTVANLWVWGRTETVFTDTVTDFDVTIISGPSNDNSGVGLYCRLNLRDDTSVDAYLLAISADGYYAILKFESGSPIPLVDWTYSGAINQGTTSNHMRATCSGNQLSLEVNGEEVASTSLPAGGATSGHLAFAAVSFDSAEPSAEAHFDNVVVSQP